MYRVRSAYSPEESYWLYGIDAKWKGYVCDNFDEKVVILGNRDTETITEASWWEDVADVVEALDNGDWEDPEDFVTEYNDRWARGMISDSKLLACARVYCACGGYPADNDCKFEIAEILNPKLNLEQCSITGSMQGQYADVIYIADSIDPNLLEDYFFGHLYTLLLYSVEYDEDTGKEYEEYVESRLVPSSEYWDANGLELDVYIHDLFDIPVDEEIEIED